jgi:hypothetical protein
MRILSLVFPLVFLVFWLAPVLMAQRGLQPKPKASDYPASARGEGIQIGAEYLVHTLKSGDDSFFLPDYLVIEVAVYPVEGGTGTISSDQFSLRINGKKQVLWAQPPGFVAASLKYPDWTRKPALQAGAAAGNTGIILGRPAPVARYPGDPEARRRLPDPPKVQQQTGDYAVTETALANGKLERPVSGYLYFEYKGKTAKIKSLELIYRSGEKTIAVPLL